MLDDSDPEIDILSTHDDKVRVAAHRLYLWDMSIAAALWPSVSFVEVTLRNAMNDELCEYFDVPPEDGWHTRVKCAPANKPSDWDQLKRQYIYLTAQDLETLNEQVNRVKRKTRSNRVSGDLVVGKVSLGIWGMLLDSGDQSSATSNYEQTLWEPCLKSAFPNYKGKRGVLRDKIRQFSVVRNRIAHHEHLIGKNIPKYVDGMRELLGYIDEEAQDFFVNNHQVQKALDTRDDFIRGDYRL